MKTNENALQDKIVNMCVLARKFSKDIAHADEKTKNKALQAIAEELKKGIPTILQANKRDCELAKENNRKDAYIDRLQLSEKSLLAMIDNIEIVKKLSDPVGKELAKWTVPSGLEIVRRSIPLGVIGIIYESRPNVTCDAALLGLKSGNATILRPGSDAMESALAIMSCIHAGLINAGLPKEICQLIDVKDRDAVDILIQQDQYIDVIVPRGGAGLIQSLIQKSKIPLFKHLAGVCHTYIHKDADLKKSHDITFNAKMRRTGICGATETILIDNEIIDSHLPLLIKSLKQADCEIRGDEMIKRIDPAIKLAVTEDWSTEYLDAIVSIKAVESIDEAIAHIAKYGTQHTESIITENKEAAKKFHREVDSAITIENASTQFADGGEFGMGLEIGISTGRLHARGPVGVEQLTTYKYEVVGNGQVRN